MNPVCGFQRRICTMFDNTREFILPNRFRVSRIWNIQFFSNANVHWLVAILFLCVYFGVHLSSVLLRSVGSSLHSARSRQSITTRHIIINWPSKQTGNKYINWSYHRLNVLDISSVSINIRFGDRVCFVRFVSQCNSSLEWCVLCVCVPKQYLCNQRYTKKNKEEGKKSEQKRPKKNGQVDIITAINLQQGSRVFALWARSRVNIDNNNKSKSEWSLDTDRQQSVTQSRETIHNRPFSALNGPRTRFCCLERADWLTDRFPQSGQLQNTAKKGHQRKSETNYCQINHSFASTRFPGPIACSQYFGFKDLYD